MLRSRSASLLPRTLHKPLGAVALLAAVTTGALAVRYAGQAAPGRLDRWAEPALERSALVARGPALALDRLGNPLGAALVFAGLVGLCLLLRRRRMTVLAITGVGSTIALTTLLKRIVGRTIHGGFLSYPSGHTALLTVVALVVALLTVQALQLSRLAAMLVILTEATAAGAAAGWAESGLTAHYLTDTIGGFCTALAVVPATAWLIDRIADRLAR